MILQQGRTQDATVTLRHTTSVWDGVTYQVWLNGHHDTGGVLIGHLARRSTRTRKIPDCDWVWHATTDTRPPTRRSRWWSAFDRTGTAEAFLLGMWLSRHTTGTTPDTTPDPPGGTQR